MIKWSEQKIQTYCHKKKWQIEKIEDYKELSIKGVVSKASSNHYQGKELWSFRLNGDNNYYNTGERVPPVQPGQSIEFDTKLSGSGKHQVIVESIRPWKSDGPVSTPPSVSALVSGGKDKYWSDKETRDIRNDQLRELGASRNTAIAIVNLMLTHDAVTLPAKKEKREEVIYQMVEHYAGKLMGKPEKSEETVQAADAGKQELNDNEWN